MSTSNDAEMFKVIEQTAHALKSFEGFTARWAGGQMTTFVKEGTALEAAVARARGVLETLAAHFMPEPKPLAPILMQVNRGTYDAWAEAHDEPALTTMELDLMRRFLDSLNEPTGAGPIGS